MVYTNDLEAWLDRMLQPERFADHAPNGLQVEGRPTVERVIGGVTASLDLIEAAVEARADAVLVHHGWFWKNEDARLRGMKRRRVQLLLKHDIALFAYHLPLDAHAELGNNVQLARVLEIEPEGELQCGTDPSLVLRGRLARPMEAGDFARHIGERLGRVPLHVPGGPEAVRTVAWCTGAAQDYIDIAARAGVDAYVTGEASERTTHAARESGIHFYAAGHHATERYGVEALGRRLAAALGIDFRFVDIDNPV